MDCFADCLPVVLCTLQTSCDITAAGQRDM